jgi:hypothetical protein
MTFERREGWERRLEDVMQAAQHEPYVLGQHDCFKVACQAVEALTGVDLWPEWAGRYSTQREALQRIVEYGGSFDGAASRLFGTEPDNPLFARRGDVLKFEHEGVPHLGVCRGRLVMVLGENGLSAVPLRACAHVWKIG